MWLVNEFPSAKVQAAYGFAPSQEWLDRVRLGAVRLARGCSASFVSRNGLVMTNHHCVRDCVQDLSTAKDDYLERGFFARTEKDERRCPKLEANQLIAITDVTDRVHAAVGGKEGDAFAAALRQESAKIEGACAIGPKLRCEVVNLFHGGKYHLYTYRRFQDVRLVFAPEFPMAAFGGYADNFEFPRYGFDVGFLRDGALPWHMVRLGQLRGTLLQFAGSSPELYRITRARIRSVENSLKALSGRQAWLA